MDVYIIGSGIIIFIVLAFLVVGVWLSQQRKRREYEAGEGDDG